jgi:hypothetical protein
MGPFVRVGPAGEDKSWKAGKVDTVAVNGTRVSDEWNDVIVGAAEMGEDGSGADEGWNEVSTSIIMSLIAGLTGSTS